MSRTGLNLLMAGVLSLVAIEPKYSTWGREVSVRWFLDRERDMLLQL